MLDKLWLIPIAPFAGFLLNGLFGKRAGKGFVTAVAILGSLAAALLGTWAVIEYNAHAHGTAYVDCSSAQRQMQVGRSAFIVVQMHVP